MQIAKDFSQAIQSVQLSRKFLSPFFFHAFVFLPQQSLPVALGYLYVVLQSFLRYLQSHKTNKQMEACRLTAMLPQHSNIQYRFSIDKKMLRSVSVRCTHLQKYLCLVNKTRQILLLGTNFTGKKKKKKKKKALQLSKGLSCEIGSTDFIGIALKSNNIFYKDIFSLRRDHRVEHAGEYNNSSNALKGASLFKICCLSSVPSIQFFNQRVVIGKG